MTLDAEGVKGLEAPRVGCAQVVEGSPGGTSQ
jgi:hypothetical protein